MPQSPHLNVGKVIICLNIFEIRKCEMGGKTALARGKWKPRTKVHVPQTLSVLMESAKRYAAVTLSPQLQGTVCSVPAQGAVSAVLSTLHQC